jgi:hypothetical protein
MYFGEMEAWGLVLLPHVEQMQICEGIEGPQCSLGVFGSRPKLVLISKWLQLAF